MNTPLKRYLTSQIHQDLQQKMVMVGGPRQVGKTTMALRMTKHKEGYLNWDIAEQRERILKQELPKTKLWIFDEIHKYRQWRNYLKGIYDAHHEKHQLLITGSARLDFYRFGGDSLQGRYHYLRLHPLSIAELQIKQQSGFMDLLTFGGFPEPFFRGSEQEAKRWSREYRTRLITEDITTLERVQDLGTLELLSLRLPELVGSPLSINALREDLQVSHKTLARWLDIFERVYSIFRLAPFGAPKIRAVKKEQKHYHYDWSLIQDQSKRFENMVASHLLKWVQFRQDVYGENIELRYFRDIDGREVDFVICKESKPQLAVECKWSESKVSTSAIYFKQRFPDCQVTQITAQSDKTYLSKNDIVVQPAVHFLQRFI